jgi:hypothetical protein
LFAFLDVQTFQVFHQVLVGFGVCEGGVLVKEAFVEVR